MRKIRKKKKAEVVRPLLYDQVMSLREPGQFFRLPVCPHCTAEKKYGTLLGRGPVFTDPCSHCGAPLTCAPGRRSLIFGLLVLLLGVLMCRMIMAIATDMMPLYVLTLLVVIGAYFLWPLTLSVRKKKQK